MNWTYIEDEADKALSLALDCKEVATVMAADKLECVRIVVSSYPLVK